MSYENAPATRMVATHCAVCSRPLVDAKSVELGIGPTCREKYGFDMDVSESDRRAINMYVHGIAIGRYQNQTLVDVLAELRNYGFVELARIIGENRRKFLIEEKDGRIAVTGPMKPEAIREWQRIPGRAFDIKLGRFTVPVTAKRALWEILRRHFAGMLGMGPKGLFVIA
jgi:hypothetical protein